ncbi:MAG: hypothetical protein ACD_79C00808G0004 [uncultured bacterium]|nr:MAG: hypothetical protein ACD_79C00808G0004 [uncultured bacterium]
MHGSKLYVGGLRYSTTVEKLKNLFSEYGEVKNVKIVGGKGIGFIEMSKQSDAESAKKELNGYIFDGQEIRVDVPRPPKKKRGYKNY